MKSSAVVLCWKGDVAVPTGRGPKSEECLRGISLKGGGEGSRMNGKERYFSYKQRLGKL